MFVPGHQGPGVDQRTAFRVVKSLQEPSWYTFLFVWEPEESLVILAHHWSKHMKNIRKKWRFSISKATMVVAWLLGVRSGLFSVNMAYSELPQVSTCFKWRISDESAIFSIFSQSIFPVYFPPGESVLNQQKSANTATLSPRNSRVQLPRFQVRLSPSLSCKYHVSLWFHSTVPAISTSTIWQVTFGNMNFAATTSPLDS